MIIAETAQLIIREFTTGDTSFIIELVNTPSWIRYIGERNIKTDEDALAYLEKGPMKSYAENGFGLYCVELKLVNVPIGMCGLIKRATLEDVDVGFAFLPAYEG
ncbi:MAG: GNAT family N-acetyltransferase, partial [Bacteroidota bacterium]